MAANEELSLSDHYVVLLDNVVNQTKLLREEFLKDKGKGNRVLEDITTKIDGLSTTVKSLTVSNGRRAVRQTGGAKPRVPKMCSVSIKTFRSLILQ